MGMTILQQWTGWVVDYPADGAFPVLLSGTVGERSELRASMKLDAVPARYHWRIAPGRSVIFTITEDGYFVSLPDTPPRYAEALLEAERRWWTLEAPLRAERWKALFDDT